jgi:hypothetical protein
MRVVRSITVSQSGEPRHETVTIVISATNLPQSEADEVLGLAAKLVDEAVNRDGVPPWLS